MKNLLVSLFANLLSHIGSFTGFERTSLRSFERTDQMITIKALEALQMPMVRNGGHRGHRESAVLGPQTHRLPARLMWGTLAALWGRHRRTGVVDFLGP